MAKTAVSAPFPAPDDDDREAVSKLKPDSPSHKEENPMAATSDAVSKPVDPTTPNPAAVEVPPTPAAPPQPPARPIPPDPFDPASLRLGSAGGSTRRATVPRLTTTGTTIVCCTCVVASSTTKRSSMSVSFVFLLTLAERIMVGLVLSSYSPRFGSLRFRLF